MLTMALDGNSLAYRAFFALPEDMTNASGQVTNAIYGFTTMLLTLLKEHSPDRVIVVFDRPEPTFRHIAIPEYKAQRAASPDILRQQLALIRELLDVLGVTWIEKAGFEGDDLLATLATTIAQNKEDILIVTGDRDSYQLVADPHIRVLYNKRGVSEYAIYDEAGIKERTGVTPAQYAHYAALRGDPSDNLPGVPGVGEKTAAKLINQYGDLDNVLAHAAEQTPKLQASLIEHGERVQRNAAIMILQRDVPIDVDVTATVPTPDLPAARQMFELLEFRTMFKRLEGLVKQLGWTPRETSQQPVSSATTQTSSANTKIEHKHDIRAVQVSTALSASHVVSVLAVSPTVLAARWQDAPGRSPLLGIAIVQDVAQAQVLWVPSSLLANSDVQSALATATDIHMHDAKPLMRSLLALGVDMAGLTIDTAIAAYLVNPSENSYSLNAICARYLGAEPSGVAEATGQFNFDEASDDIVVAEHAYFTALLADVLRTEIANGGISSLYTDIENPLVRVLARMEDVGIGVDRNALTSIRDRLTQEVQELTVQLHQIAGREFNPNSPKQLREVLYTDKGLAPGKKKKTGYSTDAATLESLRTLWPEFIEPLMRYRETEKLRSTYGEGLLAEVATDDRIHATFNQTVARTGRLSSDQPNLHNIPTRTDEGRVFRTAFVPRSGCELMVADYNQIELRCIAHLAADSGLIEAFRSGQDVHNATAARVFHVDIADVTSEQRSKAKMVSYGLAYGMEAYGLSQRLVIGVHEASGILDAYFAAFPNVKQYMDKTINEARQRGYTETLFGRRRQIPELLSDNFRVRQAGERQAMNAAIQGLAADIFKVALVRIDDALSAQGLESRIVLQVHDEVVTESPMHEKEQVNELVLNTMRSAMKLDVPIEVNSAWGKSWAAAKA